MTKKTLSASVCLISCLSVAVFFSSGCRFGSPDYVHVQSEKIVSSAKKMSLTEAEIIVDTMLKNPPAGHRPVNPGYEFLGKEVEGIRSREHKRTGYRLIEVMGQNRILMKFYVCSVSDEQKFITALGRLKQEYGK